MKKIIYLVLIVLTSISCSNNNKDKAIEQLIENKIESMNGHEVIRDLLIENGGDKEQLARIVKCSVPTINRVLNKETYLTENALKEFKNLLKTVKINGIDTFKENDPYYNSWIRSFIYWLKSIFWIIVTITVFSLILLLISISGNSDQDGNDIGYLLIGILIPIVIYGLIFLVMWIINLIWSYEQPVNLFIEKINPVFETLM